MSEPDEPEITKDFVWVWERYGSTVQLPLPTSQPNVPGFWQGIIDALLVVTALLSHGRSYL